MSKIRPAGQVEYILPKKTNKGNSTGWPGEQKKEAKSKLGNLVLLEQKLNGEAGNKFFADKTDIYRRSSYATAKEVAKLSQWLYDDWKLRDEENIQQVLDFLIQGK